MTSQHRQGVENYLNKYKFHNDKEPKCSPAKSSEERRTSHTMVTKPRRWVRKPPPVIKGKANINHLPDEVLLELFECLDAATLLTVASVCKRWLGLANDNVLWINIYQTYAKVRGNASVPEGRLPLAYWKDLCLKRCSEDRNRNVMKLMKKIHPFTGLPKNTEQTMKKSGLYFHLSILDNNGREEVVKSASIFYHSMTICIRWYNLNVVPLKNIRKLRVLSCNPLFFDKKGVVIENSPYQRSLLTECGLKWDVWKRENKPVKEDENIQLYRISSDILLATWKADEELAFVVVGYHQNNLIKRCLFGSPKSFYEMPEHTVILDDIDSSYGLHHYTCTVELRNSRQSIWSQQFQGVECRKDNIVNNTGLFVLMRRDSIIDRVTFSKDIALPWKTDLFKGVVKDVCWLDVTLLDERSEVFWTACSPVYATEKETVKTVAMNFEYKNESKLEIIYKEDDVQIIMELNEVDEGKRFITHLELQIDVKLIDKWFGTQYTSLPTTDKKKVKSIGNLQTI